MGNGSAATSDETAAEIIGLSLTALRASAAFDAIHSRCEFGYMGVAALCPCHVPNDK